MPAPATDQELVGLLRSAFSCRLRNTEGRFMCADFGLSRFSSAESLSIAWDGTSSSSSSSSMISDGSNSPSLSPTVSD